MVLFGLHAFKHEESLSIWYAINLETIAELNRREIRPLLRLCRCDHLLKGVLILLLWLWFPPHFLGAVLSFGLMYFLALLFSGP
jgi:hypothetical protein